jgi:S-methylmethionine-dependent homocysteine/selenocysteine methylase
MSSSYEIAGKSVLTRADLQTLRAVSAKEHLNAWINNTVRDIDKNIIDAARLTNSTELYHHFACNDGKQQLNAHRIDCRHVPDITERLKEKYPDVGIAFKTGDDSKQGFYINWS